MGRFINADGLVDTGELLGNNLYTYCLNNPVNMLDPSGFHASSMNAMNNALNNRALESARRATEAYQRHLEFMENRPEPPADPIQSDLPQKWKDRNEQRIQTLKPEVQTAARELIKKANDVGINLVVTQAYRSIEEQNELYAQGRTKPGKIVTNAKGGQSNHNFRIAFDVAVWDNGNVTWDCDWDTIGELGKSCGLSWGGDWVSFVDRPHFELIK